MFIPNLQGSLRIKELMNYKGTIDSQQISAVTIGTVHMTPNAVW